MHLVFIILVITIIYVLQKRLYHRFWKKGLRTSVYFDREYMECGEEAQLALEIVNDKALPLPVFHFKFAVDRALQFRDMQNSVVTDCYHRNDAFSIMGYQKIKRSLGFVGTERGFFRVETVNLMVKDFFLTSTFAETRKEDRGIYVFPRKVDPGMLTRLVCGKIGEQAARRSPVEDPLSYRGLRDYQPGDPYRSINMKQSARSGEWKVNLYEPTQDAEIRILLNLDTDSMVRADHLLEETISLVSSLARYYLARKERVSVWSNGKDENDNILTAPGSGAELSHGITIDKYLAEIRASAGKDAFLARLDEEQKSINRHALYLIISPYYKEDLLNRLDGLRKEASLHVVVPYYSGMDAPERRSYLSGWEVDSYAE